MKSYLSVILAVATTWVYGQTQFQKTTGSVSDDLGYQLAALSDGSIIAVGGTEGVAGNGWDSYVIKFNAFGEVQWANTFGDIDDEISWDVEVTQGNEIVGVGVSGSLGTPHSGGTIAKMDTAGNVLWLTGVYELSAQVDFYRVLETSTGELLATGLVGSATQGDEILLCKFSAAGNLLWSTKIGSAQADEIMGITETPEGHYLMAGLTNDNNGNGSSDFAAVKTDTAGNVIWKKNYGGTGSDRLNDVLVINGSYYFCGWSSSAGQGSSDVVLMKTDTAGNVDWVKAYGTSENDRAFNMLYNSEDSSVVLAGYTDFSSGGNNRNSFLMSTDLAGNMEWAKSYGSTGRDGHWPTGLTRTDDQGYFLLGTSNSFSSGSDDDLYLIKTDEAGNTACNLKDPQFTETTVTGWSATDFGSASPVALSSSSIPLAGTPWGISSVGECCALFADAGTDAAGCPTDSTDMGTAAIPGYSYTWTYNGNVVSTDAMYREAYGNAGTYILNVSAPGSACGSTTDTVVLTAHPVPARPVITVTDTMVTTDTADFYQWFKDGDSIPGADQQTLAITSAGSYFVMVTNQHGCSSISDTLQHNFSLTPFKASMAISVYPNPTKGDVTMVFEGNRQNTHISVYDIAGNQVYTDFLGHMSGGQPESLDMGFLAKGLYVLEIISEEGSVRRLVERE